MNYINNITKWALAAIASLAMLVSCDFLDVVPPEQPSLQDATKTKQRALGFLYSCYAGIKADPTWDSYLHEVNAATDETVLPYRWYTDGDQPGKYAFNTASANNQRWIWGTTYRYIGQCLLFLQEIEAIDRNVVDQATIDQWKAEANALIAYYHFMTLRSYGPIPITDEYIAMNAPKEDYNGRSHFDYCVDYIVNKLDEACENLPIERMQSDEWGRMTQLIVKSIKARVLLYAASPLWNGEFPYPQWKNKVETPGYGYELVSSQRDNAKWERALTAAMEAIEMAEQSGYALYDDTEFYTSKGLGDCLPYIPGITDGDYDDAFKKEFQKNVMKMRYAVATRKDDGNNEIIWGNWEVGHGGGGYLARMPLHTVKDNNGNWRNGYSGVAPTLNTVEMFYTINGKQPAEDPQFAPKADWFAKSGYSRTFVNVLNQTKTAEFPNLHINREPRFYAWIAFEGVDFGVKAQAGRPLVLEMRNTELHGYNPTKFNRDYSPTGYLAIKFFNPHLEFSATSIEWGQKNPNVKIRLAELYLNYAEAAAELGRTDEAIAYVNKIRKRAGVPDLTEDDLAIKSIVEWVRNERFIELWGEGHRYWDVRRWAEGPKYFGQGVRRGLNSAIVNPSYEQFYQSVKIDAPYTFVPRMYLNPLFYNEVYKNPQMVQAPEY